MFIVGSDLIALSGGYDSLLEHFVDDIVVSDPNGSGSFNEGKNDLEGGDLARIHKGNQL